MEIPEIIRRSINPKLGFNFEVEKLLTVYNGAVIFDQGSEDGFYVQTQNSPQRAMINAAVREGFIIPTNADGLSDLASNHVLLHSTLHKAGLPVIPTIMRMHVEGHPELPTTPIMVANHEPVCLQQAFFKKKSGEGFSHNSAGVEVVGYQDLKLDTMQPNFEFVQPFIVPPLDSRGRRLVTDTRVMIVGGKAAAGITRQAREPLTALMGKGLEMPKKGIHFPTADNPVITEPDPKVWPAMAAFAEKIAAFMSKNVQQYQKRLFSPLSQIGLASMDFLLDSNGMPLLVDFDLRPRIREQIMPAVAQKVGDNLIRLSRQGDVERPIFVLGDPTSAIVQSVLTNLYDQKFPADKIIWQDYKLFYE